MPSIYQMSSDPWDWVKNLPIVNWLKLGSHAGSIFLGVKGFDERFSLFEALFIKILRIFFMNISRIQQHNIVQMSGCMSSKDRSCETLFYQSRQVAAVVNVGMGENHSLNILRGERKIPVALMSFFSMSLV
jgi:hypothetical protein